jgi:hypothetical protein
MSEMGWGMFELALLFFFLLIMGAAVIFFFSLASREKKVLEKSRHFCAG